MSSKKRYYSLFIIYMAVLVIFDQITKLIARTTLSAGDIYIIPGVLQLHLLYNTGAAFSILTGKTIVFYVLTPVIAAVIIIYFFIRLPFEKKYLPMAFVLTSLVAGAAGNYIDRLVFSKVTDFIYFSIINFPVFNVADIYVTISVIVLLVLILFYYKDEELSAWIKKKS
ncbi:MAG: signal peptidase II [Lachnospiraceae bacterium]|nr:signal peptidase II [Lachnospiraceae bacterium]